MKFKEFSSIKWCPLSIFYPRSVAFVVDIMPLNKIFVTAVSDLVEIQRHLQMKFEWKLSRTYTFWPSVWLQVPGRLYRVRGLGISSLPQTILHVAFDGLWVSRNVCVRNFWGTAHKKIDLSSGLTSVYLLTNVFGQKLPLRLGGQFENPWLGRMFCEAAHEWDWLLAEGRGKKEGGREVGRGR